MNRLIIKLHQVLNMIKGFEVGYSTGNKTQCIINHEGKLYKINIEELNVAGTEENFIKARNTL